MGWSRTCQRVLASKWFEVIDVSFAIWTAHDLQESWPATIYAAYAATNIGLIWATKAGLTGVKNRLDRASKVGLILRFSVLAALDVLARPISS